MTDKPWQLKRGGNVLEGTASRRFLKDSIYKRKRKRLYEGKWLAQSKTIYRIWWDFLVRAYQAPNITVDTEFYEGWGDPSWFKSINVWEVDYAKTHYDPWFRERGTDLFAEHPDRGVRVVDSTDIFAGDVNKFYLEIPVGTPAKHLEKAIRRIVQQNVHATKTSHVPTAKFSMTAKEIRSASYHRYLKVWDMRQKDYLAKEIDKIHGTGRADPSSIDLAPTNHDYWKAKKIIKNVAVGQFPGKTT